MRATFEEGTEIQVDSEAIALSAGWTEQSEGAGTECFRIGQMVNVVLRVKNAAKAAAHILTLPPEYRPAVPVVDSAKKLEVKVNGEVVSLEGSVPLEAAETRNYHIVYRAAAVSP